MIVATSCPYCDKPLALSLEKVEVSRIIEHITRKEYALDIAKPKDEREWEVLEYSAKKDRFSVVRIKRS